MSARIFETHSAEETRALAASLGQALRTGDLVCLNGDLGAGKTTFTQGLARGLGLPNDVPVRSPTFTLVSEYDAGRLPLFHFDVYRLHDSSGLTELALDEYLDAPGIVVIEWADKVAGALPTDRLDICLSPGADSETRIIRMTAGGQRSRELLQAFETTWLGAASKSGRST